MNTTTRPTTLSANLCRAKGSTASWRERLVNVLALLALLSLGIVWPPGLFP